MERVIWILKKADEYVAGMRIENTSKSKEHQIITRAIIKTAIVELKHVPRWYTPEQWKNRTGRVWPDDWAVYINGWIRDSGKSIYIDGRWRVVTMKEAMRLEKILKSSRPARYAVATVCATEAGPPPDDWKPEEDNR